MKSKALEVNLSDTKTDVAIDEKYRFLLEIFSGYVGILNRMEIFLKELSHPYMNWGFIVSEARHFSLHYFYLYKSHEKGKDALALFAQMQISAFESKTEPRIRSDAADNLMLLMHHMAKESGQNLDRFLPVIETFLNRVSSYEDRDFKFFMGSYYQPDRLGALVLENLSREPKDCPGLFSALNRLLIRFFNSSFSYWLKKDDPIEWIRENIDEWQVTQELAQVLEQVSHTRVRTWQTRLEDLVRSHDPGSRELLSHLIQLTGFREYVKKFKEVPRKIPSLSHDETYGRHLKLTFLFYTIHVTGLSMIHRDSLGEINRTLTLLIGDKDFKKNIPIVDQTFALLKEYKGRYPGTVLECIHKIGDAVYRTDEIELINHFIDRAVDHGFQFPMIRGTGEDWQIQGNMAHVKNIRVFLDLIGQHPNNSKRLLSALIISLAIGGVFIRDTDLFPRDITRFLNSDIGPVYNLVKQLARLLPTFFNEIGAEGQLRDISTQLDESCYRKDRLIHFLRKQCHVESSSRIIEFIQQVILFWKTRDKTPLEPFVPPSIFQDIQTSGRFVDGPSAILGYLETKKLVHPEDFLMYRQDALDRYIEEVKEVTELDRSRVKLILHFYRLLNEKYGIDNLEIKSYLSSFKAEHLPDPQRLIAGLEEKNLETKIEYLLNYMLQLKEIILSDKQFEVNEAIYHKRHFAVDIPSMYGSYNEAKFDAMGLTLRVESIVNVLFEDLINGIDLRLITKPTFVRIFTVLSLFRKALALDGIMSNKLDTQMEFLKYSMNITTCSFTQYLDIFKGFTRAVADAINDHFNNLHSNNLVQMESRIGKDQILPKYLPKNYKEKTDPSVLDEAMAGTLDQRLADIFYRDRIATSLGLQQLDVFLNRILHTLFRQSEKLSQDELSTLLNYDPKCSVTRISNEELMGQNIIFLGNKGWNLIRLKQLGMAIPNGFIITTEVFKCLDLIDTYSPASVNFKMHVSSMISRLENETGSFFGDPKNPLLLSVRSGSSISQPGMLDSFLNVGINEEIAASIAEHTGNQWFAWDSYRRFLQQYGMTFGIHRDAFDQVIAAHKKKKGIQFKRYFSGAQMKEVALAYKQLLLDSGVELVESPMDQLFLAIHKVFASWNSKRAKDYRRIMGISDDWGTAVTVQSMVFGNRSRQSGSGVVFSHSPKLPGDAIRLWGDFTIGNQGEDVVAGLVKTLPISEIQRELEAQETRISLETAFPKIYGQLKAVVQQLIQKELWNPQEIEFTFEGPEEKDLFILQARDLSLRDQKKVAGFALDEQELEQAFLGQGIGVSGGAMSGRIVFTLEEIKAYRREAPDEHLILLRNDTVPDDILEIDATDGILTAKGGLTSHAAVVAYNLGKTCVVGCEDLFCDEENRACRLDNVSLNTGDHISIDGHQGSVFKGRIKVNLI
ncbi:PEP/pyruvate-binding domain-containing protein [Desulfospira joergensenii]|uniref:PEP/pyruvate-binding domain-containing protein n=1 Tax=Desulfospira joergensenii TaxID=53329 RepID=UPI0003B47CDD|nr:PEP/pyruvate-binding domain-containing protein [Desulfospira joergensenii]